MNIAELKSVFLTFFGLNPRIEMTRSKPITILKNAYTYTLFSKEFFPH